MSNQIGILIQKIIWTVNDEEIDRSFLRECTYTETIDLSGPRFSILFDDPDSILTDSEWFQIKIGDVIEVTFEDPLFRERLKVVLRFVILTMPKDGGRITFHCFQEDVYNLKIPASRARLFVNKTPKQILYELIPKLATKEIEDQIDPFPVVEDYHLLPGMRPSLLIRQMAKEQGAMAFYSRKKFYFRTLLDLRDMVDERVVYEYNNIQGENQITHMDVLNVDQIIGDRIIRQYLGWHMENGYVKGNCNYRNAPVEFAGVANQLTLSNMLDFALPVLDLTMIGDGRLEPGFSLEFVWHLDDTKRPIDESLPMDGVVSVASHYATGDKYHCRTKIVIPMDESNLAGEY
jgi:hypothetical protein